MSGRGLRLLPNRLYTGSSPIRSLRTCPSCLRVETMFGRDHALDGDAARSEQTLERGDPFAIAAAAWVSTATERPRSSAKALCANTSMPVLMRWGFA